MAGLERQASIKAQLEIFGGHTEGGRSYNIASHLYPQEQAQNMVGW